MVKVHPGIVVSDIFSDCIDGEGTPLCWCADVSDHIMVKVHPGFGGAD